MPLARATMRGRALNARFAVNGMKNAARSFGAAAVAEVLWAVLDRGAMECLVVGVSLKYRGWPIMTKEGVAATTRPTLVRHAPA